MTETHAPARELDDPYILSDADAAEVLRGAPWTRLAILGDSGAEGVTEAYDGYRTLVWADRLIAALLRVRPGLAHLNVGKRNLIAAEVRRTQMASVAAFDPNLVIALCGGNDILQRDFSLQAVETELTAIFSELVGDGCVVLTTGLFDITVSPYVDERYRKTMSERIAQLSELTRTVAARLGVLYVDLPAHPAGTESIYCTDGLHLNARGQGILATEIIRRLGAELGRA